ncbi:hypothetical protein PR202_ga30434 [Eleusine coracana subsp. coracana]|uniref:Uncharacterized protein n=1 Tax=Eleusine coracana subsp. coracana TaxID=191504 RepID=A0AAV5DMI6_ELECO|nr:hypothetical protein PR202_ga30434 [Eleusine coracana subsp. coracana]
MKRRLMISDKSSRLVSGTFVLLSCFCTSSPTTTPTAPPPSSHRTALFRPTDPPPPAPSAVPCPLPPGASAAAQLPRPPSPPPPPLPPRGLLLTQRGRRSGAFSVLCAWDCWLRLILGIARWQAAGMNTRPVVLVFLLLVLVITSQFEWKQQIGDAADADPAAARRRQQLLGRDDAVKEKVK